jgi:hypothetical protein
MKVKTLAATLSLLSLPLVQACVLDETEDAITSEVALDPDEPDFPDPAPTECDLRADTNTAPNRVATLGWPGFIYTTTPMTFAATDHTVSLWYMPQYPTGYTGPVVTSDAGEDNFMIGQGTFVDPDGSGPLPLERRLQVSFAGTSASYKVPAGSMMQHGIWMHLALRRQGNTVQLYANGNKLCTTGASCDMVLPVGTPNPTGTLRFGRSTETSITQTYGLLDDVAIYNRALAAGEIKKLSCRARLTADLVPDLTRAWTFDTTTPSGGALPAAMKQIYVLSSHNGITPVSIVSTPNPQRTTTDRARFLEPVHAVDYNLPFAKGQKWKVVQSYGDLGSHNGSAIFCYDLARVKDDLSFDTTYGETVYANPGGRYSLVRDLEAGANEEGNHALLSTASGEQMHYLHLKNNWFSTLFPNGVRPTGNLANGETVASGAAVAIIGNHPNGAHLHTGLRGGALGTQGSRTIPVAYSNFYRRTPTGSWEFVPRGVLRTGDVVYW